MIEWNASTVLAYLLEIPDVLRSCCIPGLDKRLLVIQAMQYGAIGCLKYLHDNLDWESGIWIAMEYHVDTAKNGLVECLRYAIENGAWCDTREML